MRKRTNKLRREKAVLFLFKIKCPEPGINVAERTAMICRLNEVFASPCVLSSGSDEAVQVGGAGSGMVLMNITSWSPVGNLLAIRR
jgi:hypothetical protein